MAIENSQSCGRLKELRERTGAAIRRVLAQRGDIGDARQPHQWPDGAGLYCVMNTGDLTVNHPRFQFQPLTNDQDEIEALALNILGPRLVLLLEPADAANYPFLREAKYRPRRIVISYPSWTNWVTMSWDDGKAHEILTVQFVQPMRQRPS